MKRNTIKKQTIKETPQNSPEQVAQNNTPIAYQGIVEIKYQSTDVKKALFIKKHNAGGKGLFTFLTRAVANDPAAYEYAPTKLMLYTKDDKDNYKAALQVAATYAGAPEYRDSDKVQLLFHVPATSFSNPGTDVYKFLLLTSKWRYSEDLPNENNDADVCASIDFATPLKVSAGTNILVYWTLTFANATSAQ